MDADALEEFLKARPRTKQVRLTIEGEPAPRVMPLRAGSKWRPVVDTILALNPVVIESLDEAGELQRAVHCDDERIARPPASKAEGAQRFTLNTDDPESQRLVLFATLLADAYRHSTDVAFTKMVDVFQAVNDRQTSLERQLDLMGKLLRKAAEKTLAEGGASDESTLGAMLMQFMGGQQMAHADAAAKGKPNGKVQ